VTNKRTITTTVLIEDGGIVVLGGLIENDRTGGETRVPFLGSIPIIGNLFKVRNTTATKNNLMIFIRPQILRDPAQAAFQTDLKYNYMLDEQKGQGGYEKAFPSLLPNTPQPRLPALPAPPPAAPAPAAGAAGTQVTPGSAAPDHRATPATPAPTPQGQL